MVGKGKKEKGNKTQRKPESNQINFKKKDSSKIKCFHCHEYGHYATKFLHKKSRKKPSGGVVGGKLNTQFELYFTLVACMGNTIMGSVWYLNSSASFHMTGCKEFFSSLKEKDLKMHTKLRDDGRYNTTGIGTITFEREKTSALFLKDVMFVPRLKKNLISVEIFEDHGYDIIFNKGKSFLRHIVTRQVNRIGVRVKNLYKIEVGDFVALISKEEKVQSQDVGELYHRILGHLHHGSLQMMQ